VPFVGDVSRSQYFEYHDQVNESLCPGLLALLDKHAEMIGGLLGLSLSPDATPFRYYRYESLEGYMEAFPGSGGICIGDSVYSFEYFEPHELVHAYVFRAWGGWLSNGLLREGIAVALSCSPMVPLALASYDWRDFLHLGSYSDAGYTLAGHFATYLIRQYGMQKFSQLYHAVPDEADAADFEAEFARLYPVSMDQAWQSASKAGKLDSGLSGCLGDWDCWTTDPPLGLGEEIAQDCTTGIHRTLTVGDGQNGVILLKSGSDLVVWKTCWEDAGPYLVINDGPDLSTVHWILMDPGTYTLTLWGSADLQLKSYVPAPFLGQACETAGEVQLDGQLTTQIDLPSVDGISGWIRLTGAVGKSYDLTPIALGFADDPSLPASVRNTLTYCDSCDPSATCVPIHSGVTHTLFVNQGSVLHLQNIDASADSIFMQSGAGLWFQPVQGGADQ
jgi:hypothetical protein